MKVRFYVEKRRAEDGSLLTKGRPIFMTVAFHGNRVLIATGKKVDLQWWNPEQQRVRKEHPDAFVINEWLKALKDTASLTWKGLASLSEKPGVNDFRESFEKLRPRFSGGFFDVMFLFMEESSDRWSKNSFKKVRSFYNQLKDFEKNANYTLNFNTINDAFLSSFTNYFEGQGKAPMTILKMINTLVWFLNWASEKGYNIYYDYRGFYKQLRKSASPELKSYVYLEWDELMKLHNTILLNTRAERVRDLFCIMCFTGLRFGDIQRLKREDISDTSIIVRYGKGNGRQVPMSKFSQQLVKKYENRYYRDNLALPPLSPVTMNKYLKLIFKDLGLNRLVEDPGNPGNKKALSELITAGVAVQTFIMNALRLDIPLEIISSYTGVNSDLRVKALKQEIIDKEIKKFNTIFPQ